LKKVKKHSTYEHDEQVKLFTWARMMVEKDIEYWMLEYMFAVPNGGLRDIITASRLKAEGVKRGVPDIWLPYPIYYYQGLVIEMKSEKGKISKEQQDYLDFLNKHQWHAVVCYSFEEARDEIKNYLRGA